MASEVIAHACCLYHSSYGLIALRYKSRKSLVYDRLRHRLKESPDLRHICRYPVNDLIQREKYRHLYEQLSASACHAGAVLVIYRLCLGLHPSHALLVVLIPVLCLYSRQLRLHHRGYLLSFLLLDGHRQHDDIDHKCKYRDTCTYIVDVHAAVEKRHDKSEQRRYPADDRGRRLSKKKSVHLLSTSLNMSSCEPQETGSYPPFPHGLHLSIRHNASKPPFSAPYFSIASTAY